MPSKKQSAESSSSKKCIIVESPTKAKTIARFLGSGYEVLASFGHVRDLPKSKIGIDTKNDFEPSYIIPTKAKETIKNLEDAVKKSGEIILATDEDREGEAISWHITQAINLKNHTVKRIAFHEITESAIRDALDHPRDIDMRLVNAQQARRILDRLVGYELSPFLWRKVRYGLSAGRVQSVAVRLIVEREREIQKFKQEEYWTIEAIFSSKEKKSSQFKGHLHAVGGKTIGKMELNKGEAANALARELKNHAYAVKDITVKTISRSPAPPFTTSTLQQEASRKFGFSAKQTMVIAQQLYEGIDIGAEGRQGLITYMRTDSVSLSQTALTQAKEIIAKEFGTQYALPEPRRYATKTKNAQEAHEAIRPTNCARHPEQIQSFLDRNQHRLYALIWKRTIASQMKEAALEQTAVDIENTDAKKGAASYVLRANGQTIVFDGFMKAYMEHTDSESEAEENDDHLLPKLEKEESLELHEVTPNQHFTTPPGRYTDATLIKTLESAGVGRPSTYAPTLSTIQDRQYVEKIEKKYQPTEIGIIVNDLLVQHFPEIIDIGFTAKIEDELDEIAEGSQSWEAVCHEFYDPFKKHLIEKEKTVEKQVEVSDTPCPHCGKPMIIKFGRMGRFLSCPEEGSKVTMPLPEEAAKIKELEEKTKDERCPICGKPMAVKRGRFGFFLGCTNYPKCRGIAKIWNKTGFKCPACLQGDVVEKKSRGRGKPFFACTRYPDCVFVINKKPEKIEDVQEGLEIWKQQKDKPKTQKRGRKKETAVAPSA